MDTPARSHPWITEETAATPDGIDDAIVVEPRSSKLLVGVVVVLTIAIITVLVVRASGGHVPRSTVATAPGFALAPKASVPPAGGKPLLAAARKLCAPGPCRVDVLDPAVLGWFESAFPDAVEGDGYAAYGPTGLAGFVTHLYTDESVTIVCLGRRVRSHEAGVDAPTEVSAHVGTSMFNTTLSLHRDGWKVVVTLIASRRPVLAGQSAKMWLQTAVLP